MILKKTVHFRATLYTTLSVCLSKILYNRWRLRNSIQACMLLGIHFFTLQATLYCRILAARQYPNNSSQQVYPERCHNYLLLIAFGCIICWGSSSINKNNKNNKN